MKNVDFAWSDVALTIGVLVVLFTAYALVDLVSRKEGLRGLTERLTLPEHLEGAAILTAAAVAGRFWNWSMLPDGEVLRAWGLWLLAPMVWKTVTLDIDVGTGRAQRAERLLLVLTLVGAVFSPAAMGAAVWLLGRRFHAWLHHASLSMRHLQLHFAFSLAWLGVAHTPLARFGSDPYLLAALTMHASHYWVTAFAKGWMGGRWYGWVWDNRLHDLAASAYSWGWARFLPEATYLRFVRMLKRLDRPAQGVAFLLEALAPLILVDRRFAVALLVGWVAFHLVVFLASGILFLEWIFVNAGLVYLVSAHPHTDSVLGWPAFVVGCLVMVVLPFRGVLWQARPLAWWDAPWIQKIEWFVTGESGTKYRLHNDFMCPHERLYGRIHGIFMFPRPMVGFHLGEVFLRELRDVILASGGRPEQLAEVQRAYGIDTRDAALRERHETYLKAFFARLNRGAPKYMLPKGLRWLKYPGGQCYYWGEQPAYQRQEPVVSVEAVYREEFFDGDGFRDLGRQTVMEIDIPEGEVPPAEEIHEREIEALFNARAMGRLIKLPRFVPKAYAQNKGAQF
ncbi:MAG: hypothetical protein AAGA56_09895 [Myxococcota bacterium]